MKLSRTKIAKLLKTGNQSRKNIHIKQSNRSGTKSLTHPNKSLVLTDDEVVFQPKKRAKSAHKRKPINLRLKSLKMRKGGAKWMQKGGATPWDDMGMPENAYSQQYPAEYKKYTESQGEYLDLPAQSNYLEVGAANTAAYSSAAPGGLSTDEGHGYMELSARPTYEIPVSREGDQEDLYELTDGQPFDPNDYFAPNTESPLLLSKGEGAITLAAKFNQ